MVNAGRCCPPIGMPFMLVRLFIAGWPAGNGGSRANQALRGGKDKDEPYQQRWLCPGTEDEKRPGDEGCVLCWRVMMCGAAICNVRHEKESPRLSVHR